MAGLSATQHPPGREGRRVPRPDGGRGRPDGRHGSRLLHGLGCRIHRAARRRQAHPGSRRRRGVRREAASGRAVRLGDRRRGHEDDLLHRHRNRTLQAGLHAVGLQRRYRHLHREDRAEAAGVRRAIGLPALRGHESAQGLEQVRHLRRDRREHPGEDRRARRGDHREPVRGGRLPESRDVDQGQHAVARGAPARRSQPLLQGVAGSVAASPRQALGAAQARSGRPRAGLTHRGAGRGALLRVPGVRRDRRRRKARGRDLSRTREARVVGRDGAARAEGQGRRPRSGRRRRRSRRVRDRVRETRRRRNL